ncbi:POT family MFS transporter [Roseibacillus ishigakijimensis]|uniref:POT family MFS transporter n=1 Tax=Roseibacillus ishigakijimensis TaxID=454146 RepID=A0A934VKN6_9BACT|nr:POT family MFS transporter [Roseibacillus ishigakijimensis]MBK1833839.1 POT family MFS transporter [Roseibacillus ishigakijimensis]
MSRYATKPGNHTGMPPGVPHIIGNEAAERFSFYGMKGILAVFMVQYLHLMNDTPGEAMSETIASSNYHLFNFWVYFTPVAGALLADLFWGKYRTIIYLSVVYVLGHGALALMGVAGDARWWLFGGLALIAIGSGGIKPCVSAHVGDQFGATNAHLLPKIFNWFYFSINLGAMVSMLLTPWLLQWYGPHWAFGVPGVLMALATFVFWLGRTRFVHIPVKKEQTLAELKSPEGLRSVLALAPLYLFVAMFWALFDQTGSSWVFQAQDMDRHFLGHHWLPSQLQSLNSLFVLSFIPLFAYGLYPALDKVWALTPLRKIGIGLFVMSSSFVLVALTQMRIDAGASPNVGWQVLAYALLTASEVMVSIVALEFAYTQAPKTMKSMVMCFFLFAVALGNVFTAGINRLIAIPVPEKTELYADDATGYAGADGEIGTGDDLMFAEEGVFAQALAALELREGSFPATFNEDGQWKDLWGQPLDYRVLNSRTVRLSSPGPDGKSKTKWDQGVTLTLPEVVAEKKKSWSDVFVPAEPWLEKRKRELGLGQEGESAEERRYPFEVANYSGGGSRLEGASYFWFFAGVMLLTAFGFIPYARKYRGQIILQD